MARRLRRGEITNHAHQVALKNFEQDGANRFRMTPLTSKVVEIARNLIHQHGNKLALRTLDALQLAACLLVKSEPAELQLVCADIPFLNLGKQAGLLTINPETE